MSSILDSIAQAFTKKQRDTLLSFADLYRAVADDKTVDPVKSVDILRDAGKTPEDLQREVNRLRSRRELARLVKLAEPVAGRRAKRKQKADEVEAALKRAQQAHDDAMQPIWAEEEADLRIESDAVRAKQQLANDLSPDISERLTAIGERGKPVGVRLSKMQEILRRIEGDIGVWDDIITHFQKRGENNWDELVNHAPSRRDGPYSELKDVPRGDRMRVAKEHRQKQEGFRNQQLAEIREVEAEKAAIERERGEVEKLMLVP